MKKILNNKIFQNGIMMAVFSSLVFSVMNALIKAASSRIPSNEIVFFRSVIGTVILIFLMKKQNMKMPDMRDKMLLSRGFLGALYMVAYFYTISNMPLLDAIVLVNLSPIFSLVFSRVFLKEKLPPKVFLILPLIFTGALLTIKPFGYSTYSAVALFGVLAAMFSGSAGTMIRHLGKTYHTLEIIFAFMFVSTFISLILMWKTFVVPTPLELFYLICIGVVSLLAQIFLTKAFTHENAVVVEVVRYIGIVFNALWGLLLWKEVPDTLTVAGAAFIITGCITLTNLKMKEKIKLKAKSVS